MDWREVVRGGLATCPGNRSIERRIDPLIRLTGTGSEKVRDTRTKVASPCIKGTTWWRWSDNGRYMVGF